MVDVLYFVRERLKNRTAIVSHVSQGRLSTTLTYSDSRQMAAAWGKADVGAGGSGPEHCGAGRSAFAVPRAIVITRVHRLVRCITCAPEWVHLIAHKLYLEKANFYKQYLSHIALQDLSETESFLKGPIYVGLWSTQDHRKSLGRIHLVWN